MPWRPERAGKRRSLLRAAAAALLLALVSGCGATYTRVPVMDDGDTRVLLRSESKGGETIDHGYHHPATIASVRLVHILASIDVRTEVTDESAGEREPAIPTELLYPLGDALSAALAKADSTQEVVVVAIRKTRSLGIFTKRHLTSFVAFVDADDRLELHLNRVDWLVPKGKEDEIREPQRGRQVMRFRVIPDESIHMVSPQAVAVDWRDERFRKASTISVGPGGRIRRRTVLMESEAPAVEEGEEAPAAGPALQLPTDPERLRALADLEEARRQGQISEADYQRRRKEILQGP